MEVSLFSPAKINLFLAVTGRQADGFHDLVSVAAPLDFGDQLEASWSETGPASGFSLECDHLEVPVDGTNLVLQAAEAFAAATGWRQSVRFRLNKRIPPGAGLGGGSSNAVTALRAMNSLSGDRLDEAQLAEIATTLGSDCPLFLANAPVVMRGRGARCTVLPATAAARVRGRHVLLCKPSFGISTPWAYHRMMTRMNDYLPADEAEMRLTRWLEGSDPVDQLLYNNMEPAVADKYPALPLLRENIRKQLGMALRMSGSGSACYVLAGDNQATTPLAELVQACWGAQTFMQAARFA